MNSCPECGDVIISAGAQFCASCGVNLNYKPIVASDADGDGKSGFARLQHLRQLPETRTAIDQLFEQDFDQKHRARLEREREWEATVSMLILPTLFGLTFFSIVYAIPGVMFISGFAFAATFVAYLRRRKENEALRENGSNDAAGVFPMLAEVQEIYQETKGSEHSTRTEFFAKLLFEDGTRKEFQLRRAMRSEMAVGDIGIAILRGRDQQLLGQFKGIKAWRDRTDD